jgi:hypothetical protein
MPPALIPESPDGSVRLSDDGDDETTTSTGYRTPMAGAGLLCPTPQTGFNPKGHLHGCIPPETV